MVEQFLNHIQRHNLCKTSDKILLAVSGGVDSMVMLDLFTKAGFNIAVAHCNFQLRGEDSDGDEVFVVNTCAALDIRCYVDRFCTATVAAEGKESIQVAARKLRYAFFEKLVAQHSFDWVATAHQLNDNLETVLLNLIRGTGINGLAGIPVRNGKVIRPLLFASREMVNSYAEQNSIRWREDRSNLENDYNRNLIRNQVVPLFRKINPALEATFRDTSERISAMHKIVQTSLDEISSSLIVQKGDQFHISIEKLMAYEYPEVILWEMLKRNGFNYDQCRLMVKEHPAGRIFESHVAVVTIDRTDLIVEEKKHNEVGMVNIGGPDEMVINGEMKLRLSHHAIDGYTVSKDISVAQLDAEKIIFPLIWRPWMAGDTIIPLGMNSKKKVSDLLIDRKIPLPDKKRITVLQSGDDIVWVVGLRINDCYKVTSATKRVIIIECLPI